jgi:hypothetical protein
MKKTYLIYSLAIFAIFLSSCSSKKGLYSWYDYEDTSYDCIKKQTPESTKSLSNTYLKMIKKQKGIRKTVPPGMYAEQGYGLIKSGKIEEGKTLLDKEEELYPESKVLMERIKKALEQ